MLTYTVTIYKASIRPSVDVVWRLHSTEFVWTLSTSNFRPLGAANGRLFGGLPALCISAVIRVDVHEGKLDAECKEDIALLRLIRGCLNRLLPYQRIVNRRCTSSDIKLALPAARIFNRAVQGIARV